MMHTHIKCYISGLDKIVFILHGPHIEILSWKHPQLVNTFICGINLKKDKRKLFFRTKI